MENGVKLNETLKFYNISTHIHAYQQLKNDRFYWEHCGLTSNSQYMSHHKWKLDIYEEMGIVPWKNLIVTYDDENGNLNIPLIESEIINKVLRL